MNKNEQLAELLFGGIDKTPEYYEEKYPKRSLPEGAPVTRIGPSPTGFVHLGNLYNAIIGERLAHQNGGTFFLRIEDTDAKREVEGAVELVISAMDFFGIHFDEGASVDGDNGAYGPYRQRLRKEVYQCYAKELVKKGLAYPCFCSEDDLSKMREEQISDKLNFGYYGKWAKCRDLSIDDIKKRIENGDKYVLRFKSNGDENNHVEVYDGIRGMLNVSENYQDFVLLKSDGIPTYHFAHVIDDHLMRTTHVVRGEEWLSTLPIHVQLFDALGFDRPVYCHTAVLMKMDGDTKRKLSKRKDPEAAVSYYSEVGYPKGAIWEYLMTLANSNYEDWRLANPNEDIDNFKFSFSKMSKAGALFDMVKLADVSKNYICRLSAEEVYEMVTDWAKENNKKLYKILVDDEEYAKAIFAIERGNAKPRKDISAWTDVENYVSYFYSELWDRKFDFPDNLSNDDMIEILELYKQIYDENVSSDDWFPQVRDMAETIGYAKAPKVYKKDPDSYKGHVGDVAGVIRVAATGRRNLRNTSSAG